jgi:hypothetical protein
MSQQAPGRNYWPLIIPILFAIAYRTWFYFWPILTGYNKLDGLLGVSLGLYICSRAAANLLDVLLYNRSVLTRYSSNRSMLIWLAVNVLAQGIGFMLIFFAFIRFFR